VLQVRLQVYGVDSLTPGGEFPVAIFRGDARFIFVIVIFRNDFGPGTQDCGLCDSPCAVTTNRIAFLY
jgi:hypothetical protein